MTSTGLASGCSPRASFSSRSLSGWRSMGAGCSVMFLLDHVAAGPQFLRVRPAGSRVPSGLAVWIPRARPKPRADGNLSARAPVAASSSAPDRGTGSRHWIRMNFQPSSVRALSRLPLGKDRLGSRRGVEVFAPPVEPPGPPAAPARGSHSRLLPSRRSNLELQHRCRQPQPPDEVAGEEFRREARRADRRGQGPSVNVATPDTRRSPRSTGALQLQRLPAGTKSKGVVHQDEPLRVVQDETTVHGGARQRGHAMASQRARRRRAPTRWVCAFTSLAWPPDEGRNNTVRWIVSSTRHKKSRCSRAAVVWLNTQDPVEVVKVRRA